MENKSIKNNVLIYVLILIILIFTNAQETFASKDEMVDKRVYLTDLSHINVTKGSTSNLKYLNEMIKTKRPKAIYIEQWVLDEPGNKKLAKKLQQIANKNNIKFYLVVGRNSWFGRRGIVNTVEFLNRYEKYIDGVVLRTEPNKVNVWKDDVGIQAQILNQMLDSYSAIYSETKKRDKLFLAEFPFWYSDYQGPQKTFSQNVCDYSDKVIFLIDDLKKLDSLNIKWNDIPCPYNINITKRATNQPEEITHEILKTIKSKLTFYSNFNGYIIDSDSTLLDTGS